MRRICLALLLLMFFVLPASALEFVTETVDEGSDQGEMNSLVMDSDGYPHISFLGDYQRSLKYAWFDGSDWVVQTVDTADNASMFGNTTSIALDKNGYPHISYYVGCDYNDLRHAWFDGSEWHTETVDSDGDVGKHSSIAIDSLGNPHIGYHTYDSHDLKYAQKLNGNWIIETVVSGDVNCSHSSMVLDSRGNPHFSYKFKDYDGDSNCHLYYIMHDGTDWGIPEEVDSDICTGHNSSIALDSNGIPHISYTNNSSYDLKYAFLSGDQWVTSTVDSAGYRTSGTSIQAGPDGHVHISYFENNYDELKYAFFDGLDWTLTTVDSEGYVGYDSSIALDPSGNPAISYFDSSNQDLKFASFDGQAWNIQTIPTAGGPVGFYPDMVLDSSENPHMVYTSQSYYSGNDDDDDSPVFYAYNNGREWQKEVIAMGDSNTMTSLAIDESDVPHVLLGDSYYSPETGSGCELRYGMLAGDSWEFETVAFGDSFASMAVEGDGTPHISFINRNNSEPLSLGASASYSETLCYAVKNGDMWEVTSVDQEDYFNQNVITLDPDNHPHICYYEEDSDSLKYAANVDGSWDMGVISSDIYIRVLDMVLDDTGTPHIALVMNGVYDDRIVLGTSETRNYQLAYATLINDEWLMETVDTIGYFRMGKISIDVDSNNAPHITYGWNSEDLRQGDIGGTDGSELKYAYHDGSSWHTVTLDSGYNYFGRDSSLVLDSGNTPHIAYLTALGVNYGTVEGLDFASGGGNCGVASFSPVMALLLLPLMGLIRKGK